MKGRVSTTKSQTAIATLPLFVPTILLWAVAISSPGPLRYVCAALGFSALALTQLAPSRRARPSPTAPAIPDGRWTVELVEPGVPRIDCLRGIRQALGVPFDEAVRICNQAPIIIATDVSEEFALATQMILQRSGASVRCALRE